MSPPAHNENGNGKGLWTAAGVCSSIVLAIVGGIGAAVERGYSRDRTEANDRLRVLEAAMTSAGYTTGRVDQTLHQLAELGDRNRERLAEVASESVRLDRQQDEALQREMRDEDETVMVAVDAVDRRLQGEIQTHVGVLNSRISLLEAALREAAGMHWTRDDQAAFEAQMGLTLRGVQP